MGWDEFYNCGCGEWVRFIFNFYYECEICWFKFDKDGNSGDGCIGIWVL